MAQSKDEYLCTLYKTSLFFFQLIIFTPKSLLRHPEARSSFDEFTEGTFFHRLYHEDGPASQNREGVKKVLFCSGKVYYELKAEREKRGLNEEVAICRVEQVRN